MLILITVHSADAFDGKRKGFVLGGGVGFAPRAAWSVSSWKETKSGAAGQVVIGYAWDNSNMIVWDIDPVIFNSDMVLRVRHGSYRVGQVFDGVAWYHYFAPDGHGAFVTTALGRYRFFYQSTGDTQGPALQIGLGYEFVRQVQFGVYFSTGRTSNSGATYHREQITFLVSGIAY